MTKIYFLIVLKTESPRSRPGRVWGLVSDKSSLPRLQITSLASALNRQRELSGATLSLLIRTLVLSDKGLTLN